MLKRKINNKIYHSLTAIILTIAIFVGAIVINDRNVSDKFFVKYKYVINEKALIYLNNLDAMVQDFKITVRDDPGLTFYVMQLVENQTEELTFTFKNKYGLKHNSNYIFLQTDNINNATSDISKLIENINKRVKDDLTIKLDLYYNIAGNRVEEENDYIMSQMSAIEQTKYDQLQSSTSDNNMRLSMEDHLDYLKDKLIKSNQAITIPNMQQILRDLNYNDLWIKSLRDKNIQLTQLKKRSKELLDMHIIQQVYMVDSKSIKTPLSKKIILAFILGLVISLIYVYFYLTVSLGLLRKKLTFLIYKEK